LSWRARQFDFHTEFIELAGRVNQNMPYFCREKVGRALNVHSKPLRGSHVLVVGVAYKPDIDDTRESPALKLIELLRDEGCEVSYHDPYVARLREFELDSVALDPAIESSDCVVVVTNHSSIDYDDVVRRAPLGLRSRPPTPPTSCGGLSSSSTSATPPGLQGRPTARSSSCERPHRRRRPGLLGPE